MSDRNIAWIALWVSVALIALCIAAIRKGRADKAHGQTSHGLWHFLSKAASRPHAGQRLFSNLLFWLVLWVLLVWVSGRWKHLGFLAVDESTPLSATKFVEYADGELWFFQIIAATFVFILYWLIKGVCWLFRAKFNSLEESKRFIVDDFWGAVLNFGSLFVVSGFIQAFQTKVHFLVTLILGFLNVMAYAFLSNLDEENAHQCTPKPAPEDDAKKSLASECGVSPPLPKAAGDIALEREQLPGNDADQGVNGGKEQAGDHG